jgi:hypothetical protein
MPRSTHFEYHDAKHERRIAKYIISEKDWIL